MKSSSLLSLLGIIISVLFLWIFFFSVWYSNNITNKQNFVNKTTQVLQSETVRTAISNEIIDTIKQKRPLIGTLSAPVLSNVITGVLDTDLFANIYRRMAGELHLQLTSKNPRPLIIDVAQAKEFIAPLIVNRDATLIDSFPNQIVIIGKNQIPSLYLFGTYLGILGPLLLIAGLVMLGFTWYKSRDKRSFFIKLFLTISAYGVLIYFLIPTVGNYLVSNFQSINLAIIVNEVFNAFTDPIVNFSMGTIIVGFVGAVICFFLKKEHLKIKRKKKK